MKKILILMTALIIAQIASSQNILSYHETRNVPYLKFSIEPTYTVGIGYMHISYLKSIQRPIGIYGEMSSPTKLFGFDNYEIKAGGIVPLLSLRSLGLIYDLNLSTGHVATKNFHSQKFAFGNKLSIGVFKERWHLAFAFEHEKIFANKLTHSRYYRDFIYPEAQDGWYKGAGGNIQMGVEFGFTLIQKLDLNFELKVPRSEKSNSYNGSPAHISVITAYRF